MKTITKTIMYLQMTALFLTTALGGPREAEKAIPFRGNIQVAESGAVDFPILFAEGSGVGNATHLGRYSMTFEAVVNLLTGAGSGTGQFIAADGDIIFFESVGQATPTETPGVLSIVEESTITGGTGRFAGATGSFTIRRWTWPNLVDGQTISTGSFCGTLVIHKNKHKTK